MKKKKEIQLNITHNNKSEQNLSINDHFTNNFATSLLLQFRDNWQILEAQRISGTINPTVEIKTINNDENICNSNIRMKLWQNF